MRSMLLETTIKCRQRPIVSGFSTMCCTRALWIFLLSASTSLSRGIKARAAAGSLFTNASSAPLSMLSARPVMRGRSRTIFTGGSCDRSRARLAILEASSPMRSRFWEIFIAVVTRRKLLASGALVSNWMTSSSISTSNWSMTRSLSLTRRARSRSRWVSAWSAWFTAVSAWLAIVSSFCFRTSNSMSKCSIILISFRRQISTEPAGHIIFRLFLRWTGENLPGHVEFHQFAQIKERGEIRHARGLLHVVGHNHNRVVLFQFQDQVLYFRRGQRVECRGRFVHEQHLRLHGERARNAQALLLAARKADGRRVQAVFDLVPKRGHAQRLFHAFGEQRAVAKAVQSQADRDVVGDGHGRERIRFLEHHADAAADDDRLNTGRVNVVTEQANLAGHPRFGHEFMHPVERAQKSGFAAAAGANDGGDGPGGDVERDVLEHMIVAEEDREIAHGQRGDVRGVWRRQCGLQIGFNIGHVIQVALEFKL